MRRGHSREIRVDVCFCRFVTGRRSHKQEPDANQNASGQYTPTTGPVSSELSWSLFSAHVPVLKVEP